MWNMGQFEKLMDNIVKAGVFQTHVFICNLSLLF